MVNRGDVNRSARGESGSMEFLLLAVVVGGCLAGLGLCARETHPRS